MCSLRRWRGGTLFVEDYADRVRLAAGYLSRLLADGGSRVDNPADEPVGPEDATALELAEDAPLVQFGCDPAPGVTAAAVDGGSACLLNGRSFWLVAYRAGTVWHRDRDTFASDTDPLQLRALTQTDAKAAYAEALALAGVKRERELADLGGVVDVLRELAEWRRTAEAVAAARPGDLVLVDGSLHPGPFLPTGLVEPVHELARERGVDLVGVTKASKLRWGRYAPLVLRVRRRAEGELGPEARWYLRVTGPEDPAEVYVARLARAGAYAFRVDAVRGARDPGELFAVLAGLSDDPAFLGYPYPLAAVHRVGLAARPAPGRPAPRPARGVPARGPVRGRRRPGDARLPPDPERLSPTTGDLDHAGLQGTHLRPLGARRAVPGLLRRGPVPRRAAGRRRPGAGPPLPVPGHRRRLRLGVLGRRLGRAHRRRADGHGPGRGGHHPARLREAPLQGGRGRPPRLRRRQGLPQAQEPARPSSPPCPPPPTPTWRSCASGWATSRSGGCARARTPSTCRSGSGARPCPATSACSPPPAWARATS